MANYMSKTQIKNLMKKNGLKVSKTMKGRVASYPSSGVVVTEAYYGDTMGLEDSLGFMRIFYNGDISSEYAKTQRKALADFLTNNGFENVNGIFRKTR